jgi:hypothetical protein
MSDLVERLRAEGQAFRGEPDDIGPCVTLLVEEAADEITRLTARVAKLEGALREIIEDSFSVYAIQVARAALTQPALNTERTADE